MRQRAEVIDVLAADPSRTGIFVDFDGTLSPIVPRPEDAAAVDGAIETLETLARSHALVAVVSGRSLEDLRKRVPATGVLLAGSYGRERSDRPSRRPTEGWETVSVAAGVAAREIGGVRVERKGTGVALHYRAVPERSDDVREVADLLAREFGLEVRPGRMVVELIVPGPGKGDAIASLIADRSLERVLVAGDDWGDLDAFGTVRSLDVESAIAAVLSDEAPPGLTEDADIVLAGPAELVGFLKELAARAEGTA